MEWEGELGNVEEVDEKDVEELEDEEELLKRLLEELLAQAEAGMAQ